MNKTHASALGALVIMAGLVSGCASEDAAAPAEATAVETTTTPAPETVFEDFLILGAASDDTAPRALLAGQLDSLAYYVRPSEGFKDTFSGDDMFAFNQLAGQYFVEQIVDSPVLDVAEAEMIREHAERLSELLTVELASELTAAGGGSDDVFPSNIDQAGMTADPEGQTEAGTRFSSVEIALTSLDVTEDGERPVLVYEATTVRPVVDAAGEAMDEHRSTTTAFEVDDVDGQWRISSIETDTTTQATAAGAALS